MWAKQKGFTIVELLVVIVVIGILASITVVSFNGIQNRAKATKNKVTASEVATKTEIWSALVGSYPTYGQLRTNSLSPTTPGGVWTAGGAAGPAESKLNPGIVLVDNFYPLADNEVGYIPCATPGGYYAVYRDPTTPETVNASPIGSPTPISYGSSPFCL